MNTENPRHTILIVDDTPENIDVLDGVLSKNYKLRLALSGEKALQLVVKGTMPDLILLDIMMPGMDGYEVIQRLKSAEATRHIPVIFLTAKAEIEDEMKGFELGAVDYITKPFSPPIVESRVATQLALKAARDELALQNEELREAARLREDVERMARHDLKSPLNSVIAIPDFLLSSDNLTEEQKESVSLIKDSGYQMLHMVNLSLDLFKMEQGTYNLHPENVDILGMSRKILTGQGELLKTKSIAVHLKAEGKSAQPGEMFDVAGDELLLYSMMSNLIKNAIEASPDGGPLSILCNRPGPDEATVIVHNMGAIPEDMRERFFEKYATSGKEGGTGIGTYSAKLIAETHKGSIRFESSEEKGTAMIVTLPAAKKAAPVKRAAPKIPLEKMTFLICDDMQNIRMIVKSTLGSIGCKKVMAASDGKKAIEALQAKKADFIISDWNMPNVTGLQFLQWVRSQPQYKDIPFLMVTAETTHEQVLAAAQSGVSNYIVKPFTPLTLINKIKETLGK